MNQLFYGDNLEILRKDIAEESIDLCYIDPPFNSDEVYNQIYNNKSKKDIAQVQAFVDTWVWDSRAEAGLTELLTSYNPHYTKQLVGLMSSLVKIVEKGSLLAYLVSMALRIVEIHRVLKPTGSFYLHCDPTASHYLKLIMDSIFLPKGGIFKNEIVWKRTSGHNDAKSRFGRNNDIILFYTKSKRSSWNKQYTQLTDSRIRNYSYQDEDGRLWASGDLTAKGLTGGGYEYEYKGVTSLWRCPLATMQRLDEENRLYFTKNGIRVKRYLDESKGQLMQQVFDDISPIASQAKERLGYPTQKPEALLERIIAASSNEGDTVLDCYCGCGTTIAVAEKLNRNWIGVDITYQSISLILKRLQDSFGESVLKNVQLSGIPKDMESARALANKKDDLLRKEFEKWAILTYANNRAMIREKKGADKGIDGVTHIVEGQDTYRDIIFSVKSGKVSVAQIRDLRGVIERENAAVGILICLEEPTKPMLQECKEAGTYHHPLLNQSFDKLQIVTIDEILKGTRLSMPLAIEVLKSAERKQDSKNQGSIF
jgi:site-specific DNA-methyltransferase (adenine-specific)